MQFECLCTGSTGNCYLVNLGSGWIILDAGCNINRIEKNINLNEVKFAFLSHNHHDHDKSINELQKRKIKVVFGNLVDDFTQVDESLFIFPVEHGETRCGGCIIQEGKECVLYITDFNLCKWDLSDFKFTSIIIECNYIRNNVLSKENSYVRTRENIYRHHSMESTIEFLKTLNLSKCEEIYLIHMSQLLGDRLTMGATVYSEFLIPVGVCEQYGGVDWYGKMEGV